jgi:hypothetical protein
MGYAYAVNEILNLVVLTFSGEIEFINEVDVVATFRLNLPNFYQILIK